MLKKELDWQEPLQLAKSISTNPDYNENWALLYSGLNLEGEHKSYLALHPQEEVVGEDFDELEEELKKGKKWFGYLSYDLKNCLEELTQDKKRLFKLPNLWMINFGLVLEFNHKKKTLTCFYKKELLPPNGAGSMFTLTPCSGAEAQSNKHKPNSTNFETKNLQSNYSKADYLQKLSSIQNRIKEGDLYQANLTRKFFGEFTKKPQDNFDLFLDLNKASPANYSSFLKLSENSIISSSPELFLSIDENGKTLSSPIKGTTPRDKDPKIDLSNKEHLLSSPKERAENLMIVDLVRNDLSRNCLPNSVKVEELFKINSYTNVHHMSSDVSGIKDQKSSSLDLIKNCFPPASMTGTPKIKAMEVCSELEKDARGVYSGAIGFLDQNTCHLSVVIRTLIVQNNIFEFQVGGAITFDSDPQKEWEETINKAKSIAQIIRIDLDFLKKI